MPPAISVTGLSKTFNGKRALNDINLNIAQGEFVALIGASRGPASPRFFATFRAFSPPTRIARP